jgi:hypothetical protein
MKRTIHLFLLVLLLAMPSLAQEFRPWEVFAGYSFQRADVREYYKTSPIIYTFRHHYANLNGWETAVTENVNHWFGGTLEFSGYYKTPQFLNVSNREQLYTILYGPRFSYRKPYGTAFVHGLLGAARTSVDVVPTGPHATDYSFALDMGGGVDLTLTNQTAVRLLQLDYLRTNALGSSQNNYRLSAGIVLRFGKGK